MKILLLCNKAPYPPNDGSSIAIYQMANGLLSAGATVNLLTINTKKHFKSDSGVPADFKERTKYTSVYHNTDTSIPGAIANLFSTKSYFVSRFYFEEFKEKLIASLRQNAFDIIQLEGLFMAIYLPVIRKYSKAKVVLRAHNVEHVIWERHITHEKSFFKKNYLRIQNNRLRNFELNVFNSVDAIVSITDADKDSILKLGITTPCYTSITGVSIGDYELNNTADFVPNSLFYFGAMDWLPNVEAANWFVENCYDKLKTTHPNTTLVIAGKNMPGSLKHLSHKGIRIEENVLDKRYFYATYQIMLVPLLSGSGLRIKIIEGMAYGKAIISTRVGAEGINCEHGRDILIADTPDEFITQIGRLLHSSEELKKLEVNAKAFAKTNFDNDSISKKLLNYYKQEFKLD